MAERASAAAGGGRIRLDVHLVRAGLFPSRAKAQEAIAAGLVTVDGTPVRSSSDLVSPASQVHAEASHPYVGRGGVKLAAALDAFGFDPRGRWCLDVGASTGGFTDALLARGARHVCAVDVGHGQLAPLLAQDVRVTSMEGTDIRALAPGSLPERPTLMTIDVSFISLTQVLPAVFALGAPSAAFVALIKPQFEAGRGALKKGIVRDPAVHDAVCERVSKLLVDLGSRVVGLIPSPIAGGSGNREFLIGAVRD